MLHLMRLLARSVSRLTLDDEDRVQLLGVLARRLLPGYRMRWPSIAWWNDHEFNRYLAHFGELDGLNSDRKWMLYQLLRMTTHVPGDTAECGVYRGASSYLICLANESYCHKKAHH